MNNKPTKLIEASKIRNKNRHPSQNELPPIDKFHPDWWYYRQEMEEPVEIDDNYKNESRYMNKKLIRLTEQDLHRIVKESVDRILNEVGDTKRGQYMLGRLKNRQSNGGGKFTRGINYNDAGDYAYKANGNSYSDDYQQGYEDEEKYGRNADSTWDGDKYRRMKFKYDVKQMQDMDNIGKRFIDFIEKHHDGALLQTIVDFETGNETGTPTSPLPTIIPEFEEAVVGHKCTPEMRKAIKAAYNQWWNYAEPMLTDNY